MVGVAQRQSTGLWLQWLRVRAPSPTPKNLISKQLVYVKKVIILLGPTGVGKTSASILLAKALSTEIISSDSMQIYRHMNIGTAKPSQEQMRTVKHHMIDIIDPWESYSTGEYINDARLIIDNLHKNNKTPVIVGGTGLYIKAMTRGIFKGPSADWDLRNSLLKKEQEEKGFLYEYLKSIDAEAALKIMPADSRRLVRALEICLKSNKPLSELHQLTTQPLPYEFIKIGMTRERNELYEMIEQRVDNMIENGLIKEVETVLNLINKHFGKADPKPENYELSAMQAIGYKEIVAHLKGVISLKDAITLVKQKSRNYAKRQFTWFKKEQDIRWIDATGIYEPAEIFDQLHFSG